MSNRGVCKITYLAISPLQEGMSQAPGNAAKYTLVRSFKTP